MTVGISGRQDNVVYWTQILKNPGLYHHSTPSLSIQNDQTLGQFCEPLYSFSNPCTNLTVV